MKIQITMRLKNEEIITSVNQETGEIIKETKSVSYSIKTTADQFYFTFLSAIGELVGLTSLTDRKVLDCMCRAAEFNTGRVLLPSGVKEEVFKECGFKSQTINNSLSSLKQRKFISGGRGVYIINPDIFWKGDLKTREHLLKNGGLEVNLKFENE